MSLWRSAFQSTLEGLRFHFGDHAHPSIGPGRRRRSRRLWEFCTEAKAFGHLLHLKAFSEGTELDLLWRCKTRRNLTDASLPQLRRGLARVLHSMIAMQINEALAEIERLELQLGDLPPSMANRFRAATRLFRAAAFVLQDNNLAALGIALSHLNERETCEQNYFAATLCRLAFWQHGMFDFYYSLARQQGLSPCSTIASDLGDAGLVNRGLDSAWSATFGDCQAPGIRCGIHGGNRA